MSFTRATTATYVHPTTGLITSAASGQLRIEANGALIEGQRTNILLWSRVFDNAAWVATNTAVAANQTGEDGVANSTYSVWATDTGGTLCQAVTIASAAYSGAFSLKRITGTGTVKISLDNGVTYGSDLAASLSTSVWYRASKANQTLANPEICLQLGTSGDNVAVDYAQVEAGAFSSSRIGTTTAAVTRNLDALSFTSSGNISATAGTFSATSRINGPTGSTAYGIWMSTNETNNRLAARIYTNTYLEYGTGSGTITLNAGGVTSGTQFKLAVAWDSTGGWAVKDGGTVASNTTDPSLILDATSYIGSRVGTANHLFGNIKNVRIWNKVLTSAELQLITTP
jgi:hypothetical protein